MNEVEIFGPGKGAAQVFNTSGSLRMYANIMQQRAMIQQKEQAMLQEMVNTYDPNKQDLRTADVRDYQQLYSEWKNIHLTNKELMKNPSKYPDQYRYAEELKTKMNFIARGSKEVNSFAGEFGKMALTNDDKFTDGSVEAVNGWRNKSVMQIYNELGHLPTYSDVELKAKPPKREEIVNLVEGVAKDNNAITYGAVEIGKGRAVGVGDYEILVRPFKKVNPEAVDVAYGIATGNDANIQKYYNQKFKSATPEQIGVLQNQIFKNFGVQVPIESGEDYGKATWMVEAGIIQEKEVVKKDEAALAQQKREQFNWELKQREALDIRNDARDEAKQRRTAVFNKSLQNTPKTEQEGLYDASVKTVQALNRSDATTFNQQIVAFSKNIPPALGTIKTINPKKMSLKEYKEIYKRYTGEDMVMAGADVLFNRNTDKETKRDDAWIEGSYGGGRSVMFLPVQDENGNKKYIPVDPKEPNAAEKLMFVLNKGFQFSLKSTPEKTGTNRK
jgi:hypothetical protein